MFMTALCLLYETTVKSGFYGRGTGRQRGDRWQRAQEVLGCLISYLNTFTNKKEGTAFGREVGLFDRGSHQTSSLNSLDPGSPVLEGFYWKITILNLLVVVKVVSQVVVVSSGG